jgi:hypothetical protein
MCLERRWWICTKITDLKLATSAMYGLKLGYYLDTLRWLGIEGEIFNTNPHVKQQTETLTPPSGPSLTGTTSGSYLTVLTLATNVVVRYPGESLQPYIGVDPGSFLRAIIFQQAQRNPQPPRRSSD